MNGYMNDWMSRRASQLALVCGIVLAACAGCGSRRVICDVAGNVTLDSVPLAEGEVNLYSASMGWGAAAPVVSGSFVFGQTLKPGEYKVSVTPKPVPPPRPGDPPPPPPQAKIPPKYQDFAKSGLTFMVREGKNTLDVKLE